MSQQIYDLIRANVDASAAYDANDDQGVVDALAAETTEIRDQVPKTSRHLILTMGDADARLMLGTMRTVAELDPLMASMWTAFATGGINFAEDQTQANITVLAAAGVWPDALTQKLRELGVVTRSVFEVLIGVAPNMQHVTAGRVWFASDSLNQKVANGYNTVVAGIEDGSVTDAAGARAVFDAEVV
jgi:hypothetical protein